MSTPQPKLRNEERDFGLASRVASSTTARFFSQDGTFTVHREELSWFQSMSHSHTLHWTVVHPIREGSPMHGMSAEHLAAADAEFVILLTPTDETFSQTVHARTSYKCTDVVYSAKFSDMFLPPVNGRPTVDIYRLHDIEPAELPRG